MASRAFVNKVALAACRRSLLQKEFTAPPAVSALRCWSTVSSTATTTSQTCLAAGNHSRRWSSNNTGQGDTTSKAEEAASAEEKANESEPSTGAPVEEETDAAATPDDALTNQVKELKDALLRSLAEQENTRRIAARDVADARQFAIKSFAKSLLDVSDNLERAMAAVPVAYIENKEEHPVLANLYEGIELTERGLMKAFTANGLEKFGAPGEMFDPNHHEALMEYPDPTKTPGTIGQVMKAGFFLNKRVLRPAEVGVIKKLD